MRDHRRAGYDLVPARLKKIEKRLANFFGSHVFGKNTNV
jgi:hypothetical protein